MNFDLYIIKYVEKCLILHIVGKGLKKYKTKTVVLNLRKNLASITTYNKFSHR